MEASLLRRLSHSTASTSGAEPSLPARCQRSHRLAWGRSRRGGAGRSDVEQCRRRPQDRRWALSAAAAAERPEPSAPANEQAEEMREQPVSDGTEAAEPDGDDAAGFEDDDDEDYLPADWYTALLEKGFSEEEIAAMASYKRGQLFEDNEDGNEDAEEEWGPTKIRGPGYTPFQFVPISDEQIKHEVRVHVDKPVEHCYRIWLDRLNYLNWFDLISEMAVTQEDEDFGAFWCFYQWGRLPMLELYFVTQRTTEVLQDDIGIIVEESVEGVPLVGAAQFQAPGDGREGCTVTLKLAYNMPEPLRDFVGPVGMYGHMNDILVENMALFKTYAEGVELADVQAARAEDRADMAEDNRAFWQQFREEREQLRARAEAQNWEGVEEAPPEPTEAQLRAAERAEEVRRLRKAAEAEDPTAGKKGKAPGRRGGRQPKIAAA